MKAADIPVKFPIPFGDQAGVDFIRAIPVDSQVGSDPGAASLQTGFPPDTFVQVSAGGLPPNGKDVNGILFEATAWDRWFSIGGAVPWDSAQSAAVGGYPKGAVVADTAAPGYGTYYVSKIDDNTDNPVGSANWVRFQAIPSVPRIVTASADITLAAADRIVGLRRVASVAPFNITLNGNLIDGQEVKIQDLVGNLADNPVTVIPPSGTIAALPNFVLNVDRQSATFTYYASVPIWGVDT